MITRESDSLTSLLSGSCPNCGSEKFFEGPSGGAADNIRCVGCGNCFWIGWPFEPRRIDGIRANYGNIPMSLVEMGLIPDRPKKKGIFSRLLGRLVP